MRFSLKSTSNRTFAAIPVAVLAEQLMARRPLRLRYLPLLVWGYLQYRQSGKYRTRVGGGGPGIDNPPQRMVSSGIYAWTRNPMYLGHLIFMSGLFLATRSWLALAFLVVNIPWFDKRVKGDEIRLAERFGAPYHAYQSQVPRWIPAPPETSPVRKLWPRGKGE